MIPSSPSGIDGPAAVVWQRRLRAWRLRGLALARRRARLVGAPAFVFVPLGVALGPQASGLLSQNTLAHLDAVVSLGLAILGVLVGIDLTARSTRDRRIVTAGSVGALISLTVVGGSALYLLSRWGLPVGVPAVVLSLTLGGCAAASASGPMGGGADRLGRRVARAADVLPILNGGVIVVVAVGASLGYAFGLLLYTALVGASLGVANLWLAQSASSETERMTYQLGVLLLVAGCAAHLGLAPLVAGLAAGITWSVGPPALLARVSEDIRKIQHPVLVLFLIVAGAIVEMSAPVIWLLVAFLLFRLVGTAVSAWVVTRMLGEGEAPDVATALLVPGTLGIALALNFHQVTASQTGVTVVSTVALAAVLGEVLAAVTAGSPPEPRATEVR